MRAGNGPTLVEADTYRFFHQNGAFPGSAFGYRTKEEEAAWRERDPLDQIARPARPPRHPQPSASVDAVGRRGQGADGRDRRRAARAAARRQAGPAPDHGRRVARPGLRRRRRARRPVRVRRAPAAPTATPSTGELAETKFIDAVAAVMGRRMETDDRIVVMGEDVHRLNGGTNGATRGLNDALPRPGPRHADQRERLHRPGRRHRPRRPVPPGRRVHVRRLHVGRGRPAVQPDRQGPAHVRRHRRRAVRAAQQGRDGHRLRLAALDGPGRHLRHRAGLADRRARPRRTTTSG